LLLLVAEEEVAVQLLTAVEEVAVLVDLLLVQD
jgi:hypothetical protein